jgi:hypothetical protein
MQEVRAGDVPDVAVFVDGMNDVLAACQRCEAGTPMNESNREEEFNLLKRPWDLVRAAARELAGRSVFVRLARAFTREGETDLPACFGGDPGRLAALADDTAAAWLANAAWIRSMAREQGFVARFYWQPTVWGKAVRTPYEESWYGAYGSCRAIYDRVRARLAEAGPDGPGFRSLEGLFDASPQCVFLDVLHVSEEGDAVIARTIADDLVPVIRGR